MLITGKGWPIFHIITLKLEAFVTTCYQWIYAFSIESWALWTEGQWDSFLHFRSSSDCDHKDASSKGRIFESDLVPRPLTPRQTADSLQQTGREYLGHPQYSPDFEPSDFHLFGPQKKHLGGQVFQTVAEVQVGVSQWFLSQSSQFYAEGIRSLITLCEKCLNLQCDCVVQ
jgi:hypothetical protein